MAFRIEESGGWAVGLAFVHAIVVFVSLEWLFFLDFYSYGIGPDNWWIEDMRFAAEVFGSLGVIAIVVTSLVIRIPFWALFIVWLMWTVICGAWLHIFLRDCVTRGGNYAPFGAVLLFLFSFGVCVYCYRMSSLHHREPGG